MFALGEPELPRSMAGELWRPNQAALSQGWQGQAVRRLSWRCSARRRWLTACCWGEVASSRLPKAQHLVWWLRSPATISEGVARARS